MRAIWKAVGILACAAAVGSLAAGGAGAEPGESAGAAAKGAKKIRLGKISQRVALKRGIGVRIKGSARGRLVATSVTFDQRKARRISRKTRVRVRAGKTRRFRLRLTKDGRRAVRSCEFRTITVRLGNGKAGRRAKASLRRDTKACRPKPLDLSRAAECSFISYRQGTPCLFPFPDDFHTVPDPTTNTGRRVAFQQASMPRNASGVAIAPSDYNRRDGFSPGATILLKVPGLESAGAMAVSRAVPINRIGRYAEPGAPIVVLDAETGQRHPIWAEVDANAGSPDRTAVEIHPARNFESGRRYIVALRNLETAEGNPIVTPEGFRYLRDRLPTKAKAVRVQQPRFESIFRKLRSAGIARSSLYLAWDFTVASDEDTARQMLHMRDQSFAQLGDTDLGDLAVAGDAPGFNVTDVTDFTPEEDPEVARRVRGTFTVPCYLQPDCGPGGRFALDGAGLPTRNGEWTANFDCIVPRSAVDGLSPVPGRASTYGHGLFGSASEVFNSQIQQELANTHGFTFCATDEIGMSSADVAPTATTILPNLSNFPRLADRLHQGLLNGLYLGRLMIHEDGFTSDPAFHVDGLTTVSPPVIDTSELYYVGSSQGGIFGGALTAIAPDFTRSVLNVPAMNYSVLLPRSIDYDPFALLLNSSYTDPLERPLLLALIQMLWDRAEPNGYAHRMTVDPLPGTPAHRVLMNVAFGDHQVTNFQADVQARTIGASTHVPVLYPGRWPDVDILWDVPAIQSYPFDGSAIVYGDIGPERPNPSPPPAMIGVSPPPLANVPNRSGEDPHGAPRGAPLALQLISDFLAPNGAVTNVCGANPCYAGGFTGP